MEVLQLNQVACAYGSRLLWDNLTCQVNSGELIAILGPNGSGKTSLFRLILGQLAPASGQIKRGHNLRLGYVPQMKYFDPKAPIRGWDLVALGLDGHRWGFLGGQQGWISRQERRTAIDNVIAQVNATSYAQAPLQMLSGGEQQRLRIAQSLVTDPDLLLLDEPLLSLDIASQQDVCSVIGKRKDSANTAILFITHEINPILPLVDKVIYLAPSKAMVGTPEEVITSEALSALFDAPISVIRDQGQVFILGADAACGHCLGPDAGGHHG